MKYYVFRHISSKDYLNDKGFLVTDIADAHFWSNPPLRIPAYCELIAVRIKIEGVYGA